MDVQRTAGEETGREEKERKHGGDKRREGIRKMGRRADDNQKSEEMRIKTEGGGEEE